MTVDEKAAVRELGARIGFGNMMHLAEQCWRELLEPQGVAGGEHTTGPCAALMRECPCVPALRAGQLDVACDWCCGALRVTERVLQAIEAERALQATDAGEQRTRARGERPPPSNSAGDVKAGGPTEKKPA